MLEREKFFAKARDNDGRSADAIVVAYATLKSRTVPLERKMDVSSYFAATSTYGTYYNRAALTGACGDV